MAVVTHDYLSLMSTGNAWLLATRGSAIKHAWLLGTRGSAVDHVWLLVMHELSSMPQVQRAVGRSRDATGRAILIPHHSGTRLRRIRYELASPAVSAISVPLHISFVTL